MLLDHDPLAYEQAGKKSSNSTPRGLVDLQQYGKADFHQATIGARPADTARLTHQNDVA